MGADTLVYFFDAQNTKYYIIYNILYIYYIRILLMMLQLFWIIHRSNVIKISAGSLVKSDSSAYSVTLNFIY